MGREGQGGFSIGIGVPGFIGEQDQSVMGYQNGNGNQDENGAGNNGKAQRVFGGMSKKVRGFGGKWGFGQGQS